MKSKKLSFVVVLAAAAFGCGSNDAVNIGDNQPAKTGELLSDYAAAWDGYAEAFKFPSGSDRVQIVLDETGNGYVELGDGVPPAPPTDPDVKPAGDTGSFGPINTALTEGFHYTVEHAQVQTKRIRLGIDAREIYKAWCELQVPLRDQTGAPDAPEYACVPFAMSASINVDGDPEDCRLDDYNTGESVPVNCARLEFCGNDSICSCTVDGCTVAPPASIDENEYLLDAALDDGGNALAGTFVLDARVNVRLERN